MQRQVHIQGLLADAFRHAVSIFGSGLGLRKLRPIRASVSGRLLIGLASLIAAPSVSLADTDQYSYNGNNQLVEIVNTTTGRATSFVYDANGSLVAVNAISANTLTISGFTPSTGPVGSALTIFGTGFDLTAANNIVAVNGTSAVVTSSSLTQITTSVPAGATTGLITVSNTAGTATSLTNFVVSGNPAGGGKATLSPKALSFGAQDVGTASALQILTFTNTGTSWLGFSAPTLIGANVNDFSISNNSCALLLVAGNSCTISVKFTPGAAGSRSAALIINSSASNGAQSVSLSGTGVTASASVSPASVTFAGQLINTTSSAQAITVTNGGDTALAISSITITGANASDFAISNNGCSSSVAANASCVLSVTFDPAATGSRAATLQIASNATNGLQQVSLGGTGTAPAATVAPTSLTFSSQLQGSTSAAQAVTITNSGTASLTVGTVALAGGKFR